MWLWLRKKLPKSLQLGAKLVAYVSALHLIALFALFFVYHGDNHSFSFTLNRHIDLSAPVVFLPLQKRADGMNANTGGGVKKSVAAPEAIKKDDDIVPPVAKAKEKKASTSLAIAAKKKPKAAAKKTKKIVAEKKKVIQEKEDQEKKKIEPVVEPKKTDELLLTATNVADTNVGFENVQYLGQLDLQALEMEGILTTEIGQHWSVPPGIPKNASCEVLAVVSWEGAVNCTIKKSSGIPIFDVTVRNAMLNVTLPKQFWGKEFPITFKQ